MCMCSCMCVIVCAYVCVCVRMHVCICVCCVCPFIFHETEIQKLEILTLHLSIVSSDEESSNGNVVSTDNLNMRHEPSNVDHVRQLL